ncbi:MAG TPA: MFS transporter [Negativicutes bacterium]|jgi:MFS family permease
MLLMNRNFGLLWFGQFVSQLGDKAYNIALMWWLFEKTASPLFISSFLIVSMLPELILSPVAGVYIDRWNKKRILIVADFARGITILTLAALYQSNLLAIWHIYIAALFISLCSAFFNPTTMAVIPAVVEKGGLQRANALSQMAAGAVAIIGPLLGASSVAMLGYMEVLIFNGCTYIISGIAESFLRITAMKITTKESIFVSLLQGFRYIRGDVRVATVVILVAIIHVFVGCLVVTLPFLANLLTGSGLDNLGVLQAAFGGGMIVGAVYVSKYAANRFKGLYLFYAIVCMGAGILMLGALQLSCIRLVELYAIDCIIIGVCVAAISVFWRTLAQLCVCEEMTGRVFSVLSATGDISLPVSMGIAGLLLNFITPAVLLSLAGILLIVIGIGIVNNNRKIIEDISIT